MVIVISNAGVKVIDTSELLQLRGKLHNMITISLVKDYKNKNTHALIF